MMTNRKPTVIKNNSLEILKQSFEEILPSKDGRTPISPLEFIIALVFCYLGDSKISSLESIRREMKNNLNKNIKRSAFWERLAGNRTKGYLKNIVAKLMSKFSSTLLMGNNILKQLNVSAIWIIDSSTITLKDGAKGYYPGSGSAAGIKWHACFDALSGTMEWFQLSPSSTNDRKCFPDLALLKNKLIIFDLGYYDYGLLLAIDKAGGFFLSRLKSNATVTLVKAIKGVPKKAVGKSLLSLNFSRKKGTIIEVLIKKVSKKETLQCRAIGFWNPDKRQYHWYLTNLIIAAPLIYPLYRIRWQIELIFKACKNSLNANQITSENKNIIESLLLASIASYLSTYTILDNSLFHIIEKKKYSISFQRVCKIAVILNRDFIRFLLIPLKKHLDQLLIKIELFADEITDPNYRRRKTSIGIMNELTAA